ncbi:MAG: hypothetical protein WA435_02480 [Gallionellaceae bacterium]
MKFLLKKPARNIPHPANPAIAIQLAPPREMILQFTQVPGIAPRPFICAPHPKERQGVSLDIDLGMADTYAVAEITGSQNIILKAMRFRCDYCSRINPVERAMIILIFSRHAPLPARTKLNGSSNASAYRLPLQASGKPRATWVTRFFPVPSIQKGK